MSFCKRGRDGKLLLKQDLSANSFHEDSHPVLDNPEYRKSRGIVRLCGVMRDAQGGISQEFEIRFDNAGICMCDAARFADGSIVGKWDLLQS